MQLDKESVLVSEEIQMTDWYLQLQRLRYGEKLRYEVLSHGLKTHPSAKIPSIIVQSLIENLLEEQIHLSDGDLGIRIVFFITREKIDLKVMINNKAKKSGKSKSFGLPKVHYSLGRLYQATQ